MMDVSVVMPLYNKAPHVAAAIESCLSQTLSPREVIIVDDDSTDGSREIAMSFSDPRIVVLTRSPPGPGGYAARNLGIEAASAEWIAFLDADDLWRPTHLADLDQARKATGDEVGALFSMFEVKEVGADRPYLMSRKHILPYRALDLSVIIRGWLETKRCPFWTSASAFRRNLLVEAGLFPEGRARRGGDKLLWLSCMSLTKAAFAPTISAEFHQDSVNRVTKLTDHLELPVILEKVSELIQTESRSRASLLRRLANLEIEQYARHASSRGQMAPAKFLRSMYFPNGLYRAFLVIVYSIRAQYIKNKVIP